MLSITRLHLTTRPLIVEPTTCCLHVRASLKARYALDSFEVDTVDFLHKPYFYERFDRAMQKAEEWLRMHDLLQMSELATRRLILKSDYKNVTIAVDTILYVESVDNYVKLHMADGSTVLSKISLRAVEEQLPQGEFLRIRRSYLVPRSRIAGFSRSEVTLAKSGLTLTIGKKDQDVVMPILKEKER